MGEAKEIISENTKEKAAQVKEKQIEDLMVDMFSKVYFEDGGEDPSKTFPTTEDLILHVIEKRLMKMPFDLQRRVTISIKKRTEPRKD